MTIYILFSNELNDTRIEAVVSDRALAEAWAKHHWGHHFEEWELDNVRDIAWAVQP